MQTYTVQIVDGRTEEILREVRVEADTAKAARRYAETSFCRSAEYAGFAFLGE